MRTIAIALATALATATPAAADYLVKEVGSFHVGGHTETLSGLPSKEIVFSPGAPPIKVSYGPIAIEVEQHAVTVSGEPVNLTAKEFLLLLYLIQNRGRVLSRDVLLTDVWGYKYTGGTRTVDVHVRRLREKLPVLGHALVTIKQFGYRLLETPSDTV